MPELAVSRKQRLRTLENEIRKGMEEFYHVGMKLKEIRDDVLYEEDGFDSFLAYCKDRFEWRKSYVYYTIKAAEYRASLPSPKVSTIVESEEEDKPPKWTEASVRELTRIDDKKEAARVAGKIVKAVDSGDAKLTASTVRKFVDEELGVDRAARAKETKQRNEEAARPPEFNQFVVDATDRIETEVEMLAGVEAEDWKQLSKRRPGVIKRLIAACGRLAELVRKGTS